ncbi:MAG: putative rhamnosyl transferase [Bacteroidales bacterium]|nr:putative rhamnosyl transferase [Bacteroidales bacterium]
MNFAHFIITQFNLREFPLSGNSKYESWVKWTRNRIEIFKNFTLPSILNQSSENFRWLIFFDTNTPPEFKDFIAGLKKIEIINVCYSNGSKDFYENYVEDIHKSIQKSIRWIITTRLDNDDCLHRDAVKTIQEHFVQKNNYLISLASGYALNLENKTLSHYFYPMSPFISLIENNDHEIKGIFSREHTKWDDLRLFISREMWLTWFEGKNRKSKFILRKPMWIQTVHGDNISNSFFRGIPVSRTKDLSMFALAFNNKKQSLKNITKYYDYVTWKRYFKCLIVKTFVNR